LAAGEAQVLYERTGVKVAVTDARFRVRWHDVWAGNPAIASLADLAENVPLQYLQNAPNLRPYNSSNPFTVDSGVTFTDWRARDHRGKLYLTEAERALAPSGDYWLIEPSPMGNSNPNKRWPFERFQRVVERVIGPWVQTVHPDSVALAGALQVPARTFREACGVLAGAKGYLGTEGGLHHAAAALGIPAVVIFGGCMSVECLGYPEQTNLVDEGPETPCGRWVDCEHCRQAMDRITVEQVMSAVARCRIAPHGVPL
jgi:ADP-heptose:LPS heptosyltransferase